jgi:hypothetical protein
LIARGIEDYGVAREDQTFAVGAPLVASHHKDPVVVGPSRQMAQPRCLVWASPRGEAWGRKRIWAPLAVMAVASSGKCSNFFSAGR